MSPTEMEIKYRLKLKQARDRERRKYEIQIKILRFAYFTLAFMGAILIGMGIMRVSGAERTSLYAGFTEAVNMVDLTIVDEDLPIVEEMYCEQEDELMLVDSTAYYDAYGYGHGADGSPLIEGVTVAGKVEWLGMSCAIYECNEDGSVGDFQGYYEFRDTGYGQDTGYGESRIIPSKGTGTIEAGLCIDLYYDSYEECVQYGRRKVYIKVFRAEG